MCGLTPMATVGVLGIGRHARIGLCGGDVDLVRLGGFGGMGAAVRGPSRRPRQGLRIIGRGGTRVGSRDPLRQRVFMLGLRARAKAAGFPNSVALNGSRDIRTRGSKRASAAAGVRVRTMARCPTQGSGDGAHGPCFCGGLKRRRRPVRLRVRVLCL